MAETTQLVGRTRGDQIVVFEGESNLAGKLIDVEVTGARGLTLFGRKEVGYSTV
jgi:tRNA A37 methylthiotransferase MiaB